MKKIFVFFAALAIFASCQKEDPASESSKLVFTATIEKSKTKTTIDTDSASPNKGKVSWEVDDEISVFDGNNTAVYYIAKASDISADGTATFTYKSGTELSKSAAKYTATYGKTLTPIQTYSDKPGKLLMSGVSDSLDKTKLQFTLNCGLLKLNLTALASESDKTISKIEIVGTPEGASSITYTLTCSAESIEESKDFFIVLPAGSYTLMKFTNETGNICYNTTEAKMSIANNEIRSITLSGISFSALLPGVFYASPTKKVRFTRGNLYYSTTDSDYHLEAQQNATYATLGQTAYDVTHICHFYWSNVEDWQTPGREPWALDYAYSSRSTADKLFCCEENKITVDGQSGLYNLTGGKDDEWPYLFDNHHYRYDVAVSSSTGTVDRCLVIAPDGYTGELEGSYTAEEWAVAEAAGLVCLPGGGYRYRWVLDDWSGYWSATPNREEADEALSLEFGASVGAIYYGPSSDMRDDGYTVRLVCTVSN